MEYAVGSFGKEREVLQLSMMARCTLIVLNVSFFFSLFYTASMTMGLCYWRCAASD